MGEDAGNAPAGASGRIVNARRTFRIAASQLFQLWTDPAHLVKWWGPLGWQVLRCEVDLRVGGAWRSWLLTGRSEERVIGGEYLEIVPARRLVFTWEFPGPGASTQPTIVSVDFIEHGAITELILQHHELSSGQAVDMDVGWNSTFDSLERYLGAAGRAHHRYLRFNPDTGAHDDGDDH